MLTGLTLLHQHAGNADHGQAPVVELLRLHRRECLVGLGLEAEGVEAEVSRGVVVPEATLAGDGAGLIEGGGDGLVLYQGHAEEGEHPELYFTKKAAAANTTRLQYIASNFKKETQWRTEGGSLQLSATELYATSFTLPNFRV